MDSAYDERLSKLEWTDMITRHCTEASVAPIVARVDLKTVFTLRPNSIRTYLMKRFQMDSRQGQYIR